MQKGSRGGGERTKIYFNLIKVVCNWFGGVLDGLTVGFAGLRETSTDRPLRQRNPFAVPLTTSWAFLPWLLEHSFAGSVQANQFPGPV